MPAPSETEQPGVQYADSLDEETRYAAPSEPAAPEPDRTLAEPHDLSSAFDVAERHDYRDSELPRRREATDRYEQRASESPRSREVIAGHDYRDSAAPRSAAVAGQEYRDSVAPRSEAAERPGAVPHTDHDDHLLANFFTSSPPPVSDGGDDHYQLPMSVGSQRAMWASLSIFAVFVVAIGGYSVYQKLVMPEPVELGGPLAPDLAAASPLPAASNFQALPQPLPAAPASPAVRAVASAASAPAVASTAATPAVVAMPTAPAEPAAPQPVAAESQPPVHDAHNSVPNASPTVSTNSLAGEPRSAPVANAPGSTVPSYDELIGVGQAFARKGRNLQALEAYQRALDTQPTAAAALAGIAYVHLNEGDQGLAKLFAERAVESDPTNSQGWIVLGAARALLGERAAAREAYRRCATEAVGSYVLECRQLAR